MRIWSNDFKHEGPIPSTFTCDAEDLAPHLAWDEVPADTRSIALIVDDPDAPVGLWVHWLVCDIPPNVMGSPRGGIPQGGRQVANDFRKPDYGGPCPPSGIHRYFFKVYALDVPKISANDKDAFYNEVEKHKIAEAEIMGRYQRKR